jgi:Tol biopolymer transport system component
LRENDGSFTKIGNPPRYFEATFNYPYMGASQDLTHTFWIGDDYGADIWGPGVGNGLYQYVGTGNTGLPSRIDLRNDGTPISDCSVGPFVENAAYFNGYSADGKTVWFTVKECEGHRRQIWVREDMSKTYFASKSQCTRTAGDPGGACNEEMSPDFERMSRDASRAVFTTNQQLLNSDTDQTTDLYEYVLPTASDPEPSPNLIQVSGAASNAKVRNTSAISDDGRRVYFIARGVLASNHDAHDEPPFPGDFNLYVWEQTAAQPNGVTKFVARLEDFPEYQNDVANFNPRISADGRYIVFTAYHPMVETDTDNSLDVYRYDAVTGEMTRVSVDTAGVGGNADFTDAGFGYDSRVLSNDGQQVVFTTGEALSPEDGNGAPDAYLWQEGHTTLISTGAVGGGAESVVIDGSGDNIYITSSQQLTADDIDTVADVFDVRRGGGFSFKELPPCSGEGCQPASTPAPDNGAPATNGAGSEGNYRPATISIKPMSSSQRAKLVAGGEAEVPLKVSGPGKISLSGTARIDKKSSRVIDASSRAVQAGVVNVPVTLSRRALSRLRKSGVLTVQLGAAVADSETATASLKLQTAEARRKRSKKGNG